MLDEQEIIKRAKFSSGVDAKKDDLNTEKKEFDTQKFSEFKDQFQWFIFLGFVFIIFDLFMRDGKTIWLKNLNLFNEK